MLNSVVIQVLDCQNGQRSEPCAVDRENLDHVIELLTEAVESAERPEIGILVVLEQENDELNVCNAPVMSLDVWIDVIKTKFEERNHVRKEISTT